MKQDKKRLSFTINEDYKEIGIMKAIGMSDHNIRALFVSKYLILAIAGSMIGFLRESPLAESFWNPQPNTLW